MPDAPAGVVAVDGRRVLVVADYHAGYEAGLRHERGVRVSSRAADRRERLLALIEDVAPDRLVVVGDLTHAVGDASSAEREEVETLLDALPVPVTVAKGNHDGGIEDWVHDAPGPDVRVVGPHGGRIGDLGIVHGHAWPSAEVLGASVVVVGHEHPHVRLDDAVGGMRVEPTWIRAGLDRAAFPDLGDDRPVATRIVVCPAFNRQVPGAGIDGGSFLSPFLPAALSDPTAYLLDGTAVGWPVAAPGDGKG